MKLQLTLSVCVISCVAMGSSHVAASTVTIGQNGIDSAGLLLPDGSPMNGGNVGVIPAITLGQVELQRPGFDVADGGIDDAAHSSRDVVPAQVFRRNMSGSGIANLYTSDHAEEVASVIIGKDMTDPDGAGPMSAPTGVALGAALNSAAFDPGATPALWDQEAATTTANLIASTVATRAINMSFGNPVQSGFKTDGNQLLTQYIDWSASNDNVLYVVAGNQGNNTPIPKDNFNGITVARSALEGGVYLRVSPGNNTTTEDADGDRTSVSLLAPGDDVDLTPLNPPVVRTTGTSFAAPHVTATVALLQQLANQQRSAGVPGWESVAAQRHEVMKAVLLNSADKLIDNETVRPPGQSTPVLQGGLLGMSRTVLKKPISGGNPSPDWFSSPAWDDSLGGTGHSIPLDEEMGAGQLNANRARTQFLAGRQEADGSDISTIGWDYGTTTGAGDINRYRFAGELLGGTFISISLTWDRSVQFATDTAPVGQYNAGDTFQQYVDDGINPPDDSVINDLDIILLPKFAPNEFQTIALSDSIIGTVEHLFFQIPETGEYEFWVKQFDQETFSTNQNYGVAWWAVSALPSNPPGDYNGDQVVDAQDYNVWRGNFGDTVSPGTGADGNGNGIIDAADYVVWRKNLTAAGSGASLASVPESSSIALLLAGVIISIAVRRRA